MFVLRAKNSQIRILRFGCLQLQLSLRYRFIAAYSGSIHIDRKFERLLVGSHGGIKELLQRILRAKLIIVGSELSLRGQPHVLKIGDAGLRGKCVGLHCVSNASPQIGLPGGIERKRVCGESPAKALSERRRQT